MSFAAFGKALLIVILLEVSLGGGGRLFDTGSVSPRMVLFGLGLDYTAAAVLLYRQKIPREFLFLTAAFVVLSSVSASIAVSGNHSFPVAFRDFKPLAYFLLLPFFAIAVRGANDVLLVGRILKFSAACLAVLYLIVMAIWKSGLLTTMQMYEWLNPAHTAEAEFLFRGGTTFFFKAILYVGVGVFFFVAEKGLSRKSVVLLLLLAIALTMTRGMWLAVFVVLAAWAFFYTSDRLRGAALAAGLLFVGVAGAVWINETLPSAALSNAVRMNDLRALLEALVAAAPVAAELLFGRGFGGEVIGGRQSIEITYVNMFYKQGLVGLIFWFLPAVYLVWRMRTIPRGPQRDMAMPYFMAAAMVYVVNFTNPFLTNPIGMAVVMIAMVAVRVIGLSSSSKALMEPTPRPLAWMMTQR